MDSEHPPPPSYIAAMADPPGVNYPPPPPRLAPPGVNAPSAASGPAWRWSQAVLSTHYDASGGENMVSRAKLERAALLRTSGGTHKQQRQVREREVEREKRNRQLKEREAWRAAWVKEMEEARKLMETEQKVWKKKWPWQRWGKKSPKKRFKKEEAERVKARKEVQRRWNRADGKVEFRPTAWHSGWSGPEESAEAMGAGQQKGDKA